MVLTYPDGEFAVLSERDTAQSVVRVFCFGFQSENSFLLIGLKIAVAIDE